MSKLKNLAQLFVLGMLLAVIGIWLYHANRALKVIVAELKQQTANQHAQMKQQYHSDLIALMSLITEDGIKKIFGSTPASDPKDLSPKDGVATGLLLQRLLIAREIRSAFPDAEWRTLIEEVKEMMQNSPLLRKRWKQVREYYSPAEQSFVDNLLPEEEPPPRN